MAKTKNDKAAYAKLKKDIDAGTPEPLYFFYGEEDYLKRHYLDRLRAMAGEGFGDFNLIEFDARSISASALLDAVESYPAMSERKVVVVSDVDIFKASAELKEAAEQIFSGLPDYICLIFVYEGLPFKPDKRTKLYQLADKNGQMVEFARADGRELATWIKRRFKALGKEIDIKDCDYLIFLCGSLMSGLASEIDKIAAYCKGPVVHRGEIDAVASRVLETEIFELTDELSKGRFEAAMTKLSDLIAMNNEPIVILAVITRHFERLYSAKLALDARKGPSYLTGLWGMRSTYPAELMLRAAGDAGLAWLREAVKLCSDADFALKTSQDSGKRVLELLLLRIAAARGAKR